MTEKAKRISPPVDMDAHNAALKRGEGATDPKPEEVSSKELSTKEIAEKLGTDPRTLRKFLRSKQSGVEAVGQGKRYTISQRSVKSLATKFEKWSKEAKPEQEPLPPEAETEEEELEIIQEMEEIESMKTSDPLESKTVRELQEMAKEAELTGYSSLKKSELIAALRF